MARLEVNDPIWLVGRSDLLQAVKEDGLTVLWCLGRSTLRYGDVPPPGEITPWLVSSVLAGEPDAVAAKVIPPAIVSVVTEAGEPRIEKADRPLVPSIRDIKGPF